MKAVVSWGKLMKINNESLLDVSRSLSAIHEVQLVCGLCCVCVYVPLRERDKRMKAYLCVRA